MFLEQEKVIKTTEEIKIPKQNKSETKFTKENIIKSKIFEKDKDLLNAFLEDDIYYTKKEIEQMINSFLDRRVE